MRTACGNWARSDADKANTLAAHLEKVFQLHDTLTDVVPVSVKFEGPYIEYFTAGRIKVTSLNLTLARRQESTV